MREPDFYYHGVMVPGPTSDTVRRILDDVLGRHGLQPTPPPRLRPSNLTWWYQPSPSIAPMSIAVDAESPSQLLTHMSEECVEYLGEENLRTLVTSLSRSVPTVLGRTSIGSLFMAVSKAEMAGALDGIDWYQYFSAPRTAGWSVAHLRAGPFHHVEVFDDGAVAIFLAASPLVRFSRRTAAQHLGVVLRPIIARNPATGAPIVIPWD